MKKSQLTIPDEAVAERGLPLIGEVESVEMELLREKASPDAPLALSLMALAGRVTSALGLAFVKELSYKYTIEF